MDALRQGRTHARGNAFAFVLILLAVGVVSAGNDYEPDFDIWPLLRYWADPAKPDSNLETLWPIFEYHDAPANRAFYFRPLYNRRVDKQKQVTETEWLWPLGFGTYRPDLSRQFIFPIFLNDDQLTDTGWRHRTILLPLLYERNGAGKPTDFFLFPLGGVLHDFWTRDKIIIVLWPLYVYQENLDARSWAFIHPVCAYLKWSDGGSGFKIWPLFGYNNRPNDRLNKIFILWPFYTKEYMRNNVGEFKRLFIFPFYGRLDDPGGWEWTVLWPFISQRYEMALGGTTTWYFWPFFANRSGKDLSGFSCWPIFATKTHSEETNSQFLWPFGWYWHIRPSGEDLWHFRIIPLMFIESEKRKDAETLAWQAWPVVKYRHETDGTHVEFPSIFPFTNWGPWERSYGPFFRLFQYDGATDGTQSWRLLWRLVRVDSGPDKRYVEVTPLFDVHTQGGAEPQVHWNLLKGLVGYERTPQGREYRLFYFMTLLTD